jgi:uncharacterized iron-regulated membrane protein
VENPRRKKQARTLRLFRKVHRLSAITLFGFFLIVSTTGLLLGWKKHSAGVILPKTYQGSSAVFEDWLPLDSLNQIADIAIQHHLGPNISLKLDRLDIRKEKGVAKFVYAEHYWGVQVDGATGNILHIGRRNSDMFENIHDGSILDKLLGTSNGQIKLFYSTIMGLALLTFTVTGFWLWIGPKRMKQVVRKDS